MEDSMTGCVYGPVPSRRLGYSLGVDIVPFKVCSFDCVYCQLGHTTDLTVERAEFVDVDRLAKEVAESISSGSRVDYISFSGSGEPTLNSQIGDLISRLKKMTRIPVAVITNGSLLSDVGVRRELRDADLIVPSLDATDERTFERVNRPHPSLSVEGIIRGLKSLARETQGHIWLESMLVQGVNDGQGEIEGLKKVVAEIEPEKVQLNTVIRPPSEDTVEPVSRSVLERTKRALGQRCEIVGEGPEDQRVEQITGALDRVCFLVERRPVTLEEIAQSLGIHRNEAIKCLDVLKGEGKVRSRRHRGLEYYERSQD
jgi:wyosine [tRNA(Phe)-imidazoG37] synthetase (radical SAM superfamily)